MFSVAVRRLVDFTVLAPNAQDQLLQKDAGFERGISDATTTSGAELPEPEDLEDTPCKLEEGGRMKK